MDLATMDQTVITSCSKGKRQSDRWGIFYQSVFLCEKEAEQTGEVSMKKNQRVGGMCMHVSVCVVHREDGSLLICDVPERNPEGDPD